MSDEAVKAYRNAADKALARAATEAACADLERRSGLEQRAKAYDQSAQVARDLASVYVMLANQAAVKK